MNAEENAKRQLMNAYSALPCHMYECSDDCPFNYDERGKDCVAVVLRKTLNHYIKKKETGK